MRLLTILFSAALAVCAHGRAPQSPEDAALAFYAWVLAHPSKALPSSGERPRLAALLSPELMQLLENASATETQCVKATPRGDKPLLVEGDLFVGNYEGATEIAYGVPRRDGDIVLIDANLMYIDGRFPKAHKHRAVAWKDTLELRLEGAQWRVQNVRFAENRTLTGSLQDYVKAGALSCVKR